MPFYNDLRPKKDFEDRDFFQVFPRMTDTERRRCIKGILDLKRALQGIPDRKSEQNLLFASWNIKELGHTGQRLPESYFYIAEILSRFDLIAIQEIKSDLKDLDKVMRLLGSNWRYLVTDITDGDDGNREQSAFVYNTDRVTLSGLAGEISLWDELTRDAKFNIKQLKRSPFTTGFIAGWKKFTVINLHLHPDPKPSDVDYRDEEVRLLLEALEYKAKRKERSFENVVIVGDFNFYSDDDNKSVQRFRDGGYHECDGLAELDTNASQSEAYDRMFFKTNDYFQFATDDTGKQSGGVFNLFDTVFTDAEASDYKAAMMDVYGGNSDIANDDDALRSYYQRYWRRNQLSDHYPIWVELITDNSVNFLKEKHDQLSDGL